MKSSSRPFVFFYINGEPHMVGVDHAGMMVADYLRKVRSLTGTKIVCAEGDCGACTVLRWSPDQEKKYFIPINSCIAMVAQMDGSSLVTVEGLNKSDSRNVGASAGDALTPIQKSMMTCHGSQCGFCTPGFVMAMTGLIEKKLAEKPTKKQTQKLGMQETKNALTGNLCRCTGYQPILDAAKDIDLKECQSVQKSFLTNKQKSELTRVRKKSVFFKNENFSFFAPTSLREATRYLQKNLDTTILSAGTDLGVVHNKGKSELKKVMSLHLISELSSIKKTSKTIKVGARVTLTDLRNFTKTLIPELARFLDLFASPQIKNMATLVGNVGNASPIADTPPFLLVAQATVEIVGPRGKRKLPLDEFYLGYRKTALKKGEWISAIEFEIPQKTEWISLYKVSQRKDLDISTINFAARISQKTGSVKIAAGGVAATPIRFKKTEKFLQEKIFQTKDLTASLEVAEKILQSEVTPLTDLRGSSAYRKILLRNLFFKFFREFESALAMDFQ